MLAFVRDLVRRLRPKPSAQAVQVSDEYITLLKGDQEYAQVNWNEVQEVVTFKRDLVIFDDTCLAFCAEDRWVVISEDAKGWLDLSSALGRRFPTIPPDWYETVMLPAFATCYRVLYERTKTLGPTDQARLGADSGSFKRNG
jgi:hypothetical protein